MKEKIQELIRKTERGLNPIDIVKSLMNKYTAEDIRMVQDTLRVMCQDGTIRETSGGNYIKNDLIVGRIDEHLKGNGHVILEDGEDIFIARNFMQDAHDNDIVAIDHVYDKKHQKEKTDEWRVVKILKRSIGNGIGEVVNDNGVLKVVPTSTKLPYEVEIEDNDLNLVDGNLVHLEYVGELSHNRILARVDKIMGHKNALLNPGQEPTEVSGEIAKIACEFDIPLLFPPEVLEEAKKFPKSLSEEMIQEGLDNGRVDFRNELVYTIDGKDTKDIDDAISVKILPNGNYELAVHIADVSHYVKPGSAIWKEAERRGNSNYLGNKVIPMLPVELSNGICSLNPNEDRFTTSCIMEIDHSGKVVNKKVCKGIIKSKKKMNYDAVQALMDKDYDSEELFATNEYTLKDGETLEDVAKNNNISVDELLKYNKDFNIEESRVVNIPYRSYDTLVYTLKDGETLADVAAANGLTIDELLDYNPNFDITKSRDVNVPCSKIIENAHRLSKVISAMKQRRGELQFVSDETKISQDENDVPYDVKERVQRPAERLIEDFMVAANESIAEFLEEHNMATYRIHAEPSKEKLDKFMKFLDILGIHYPGKFNTEYPSNFECQKLLEFLKGTKYYKLLSRKFLRAMQKAEYSTENIGHFGIASKIYTHFTSPIRRFDDLLNHTSLGYILENKPIDSKFLRSWKSYLTTICERISDCEKNSKDCEREVDDMLKAYMMVVHIGDEYEATIDDMFQGAFFVQTDDLIEGRVDRIERTDVDENAENRFINLGSYYRYDEEKMAYTREGRECLRYGDRVLVKCIGSDPSAREVDFALIRRI